MSHQDEEGFKYLPSVGKGEFDNDAKLMVISLSQNIGKVEGEVLTLMLTVKPSNQNVDDGKANTAKLDGEPLQLKY